MCSLKAEDSSGYDGVSTRTLKMCNSLISKALSYICNKSLQTYVFPNHLKYAIIEPLTSIINQQLHVHKFHQKKKHLKTLKITPTFFDLF